MKLTKVEIEKAERPVTGQIFLRDDALKGFGVRLTKGSASYILEKLIHGRVRRLTLSRVGIMTLDQARTLARKRMVEIDEGRDPIAERRQRTRAPTFGDLEQMYLSRHAPRKKSLANDIGIFTNHLSHWRPR
jgi:Arm domain-containing DNA-binding protein